MNASLRLALCGIAIAHFACGGLGSFDVDFPADGGIQGSFQTSQFAVQNVGSTFSQSMSGNGISSFKSAKLSSGSLSIQANALDQSVITAFSVEVSAGGLPTVTIAHQDAEAFAKNAATVALVIDSVELKPYFQASDVTFTAKPVTSRKPTFPISLHLDLKAHVQVL